MEKAGSAQFKWINGAHPATPPAGFEEYFGPGPLYRFINYDGISELDDMLSKLRNFPAGLTAEETIRRLGGDQPSYSAPAVRNTLSGLMQVLDEDAEISVRTNNVVSIQKHSQDTVLTNDVLPGNTWVF